MFLALLLCISLCIPCAAHDPQISSLKFIRAENGATIISVTTHQSKLRRVNGGEPNFDAAIRARLKIRFDDQPFSPGKGRVILDKSTDLLTWQAEYSGPATRIEILAPLYPEDSSSRFTIAIFEKGRVAQQAILSTDSPTFNSSLAQDASKSTPRAATPSIIASFGREGILHIFSGLDHVCFVLGLLLLGGSLSILFKTVTAFTLAHSMTVTLATLKIYTPSPRIIEPLIAFTIVAVAIENFRHCDVKEAKGKSNWRPLLAFGFGLIHGFGFAGALGEIGLPGEALSWALVSFNIGIEIGQAAIILLVAPALTLLARKSGSAHRKLVMAGSSAIAIAGLSWFVQRITNA